MRAFLLLCAALLCAQAQNLSIDDLFEMSLEDLLKVDVSTASKYKESIRDTPANIYVYTSKQIEERGYQNLEQLLKMVPGVFDSAYADEFYNNINMRGAFGNEKFLILMDGVRVSSAAGDPFTITYNYPLFYAKQVEVIIGPASVVYGADAFMGVVNIITKDEDTIQASASYGFDDYYFVNALTHQTLDNDLKLSLGASSYRSQKLDFKDWNSDYYPSVGPNAPYNFDPNEAYDIYAKVQYKDFEIGLKHSHTQNSSYFNNQPTTASFDTSSYSEIDLSTLYARYDTKVNDKLTSSTLLTFMDYEIGNDSSFSNSFTGFNKEFKYANNQRYSLNQDFTYQLHPEHTLSFGFEYAYFDLTPIGPNLPRPYDTSKSTGNQKLFYPGTTLPIRFYHETYDNIGGYIQDNWQITQKLKLVAGVRYDYNSEYDETINPRASLVYNPDESNTIKLLYAHSFLAPSSDNRFRNFGSITSDGSGGWQSFFYQVASPDLDPEKAQTYEITFEHFFENNIYFKFAPYYIRIDDVIATTNDARPQQEVPGATLYFTQSRKNVGRSNIYGFDFGLEGRANVLDDLVVDSFAYFTFIDGETKIEGQKADLALIHPYSLKAGATFNLQNKYIVTPKLMWMSPGNTGAISPNSSSERIKSDSYFLVDLHSELRLNKNASLFLDIENLFDEQYYSPSNDGSDTFTFHEIAQPERLVILGAKLKF